VIDGGGEVDFSVAVSSSIGVIEGEGGTVAVTLGESGILLSACALTMETGPEDFGRDSESFSIYINERNKTAVNHKRLYR
jgi:hypothetical protein